LCITLNAFPLVASTTSIFTNASRVELPLFKVIVFVSLNSAVIEESDRSPLPVFPFTIIKEFAITTALSSSTS